MRFLRLLLASMAVTAASARGDPPSAEARARDWVAARHGAARAQRLEPVHEGPAGRDARVVHLRESAGGLPVYGTDCRLLARADGTIACMEDGGVPWTGNADLRAFRRPEAEVLALAMRGAGRADADRARLVADPEGPRRIQRWRVEGGAGEIRLERGWRVEQGLLLPTWDAQVPAADGLRLLHLRLDEASGRVLSTVDWTRDCRLIASLPPGRSVADAPPALIACPVDEEASPFGWNDLDGIPGADDSATRGVNVQAQDDMDGNDTGGLRPDGGPGLEWLPSFHPEQPPTSNQLYAIVQAFALHNRMHDLLYHAGFGPADGNYQVVNYGRGGLEGDPVVVDVLDAAGSNNAFATSPPDGQPGRLTFHVFTRPHEVRVTQPSGLGPFAATGATFGAGLPAAGLSGSLVAAIDAANAQGPTTNDACSVLLNAGAVAGKIALIERGTCTFLAKARVAQDAGAIAVIVYNSTTDALVPMTGADPVLHIPAVFIGRTDGLRLRQAMAAGPVSVVLAGGPFVDGSLDHTLALHEHAHLLTQRLTGGPANSDCLTALQSAGMAEGWSDWYALAYTARASDGPATPRTVGAYAGGNSNTGFRAVAYSTDPAVNALTHESLRTRTQRHSVGEVWCSVLWEFHWEMVGDYGFSPDFIRGDAGNQRALRIVTEALKLQPCQPTFLQGRDALLEADRLLYDGEHACVIWRAFARRGLGLNATDGGGAASNQVGNGFQMPALCSAARPVLTGLVPDPGGGWQLSWSGAPGGVFRVQFASGTHGPWTTAAGPVTSSVTHATAPVPAAPDGLRLRVRMESAP